MESNNNRPSICLNLVITGYTPWAKAALVPLLECIDHWVIAEKNCSEIELSELEHDLASVPGEIVSVDMPRMDDCRNSLLEYSRDKGEYLLLMEEGVTFSDENFTALNGISAPAYFIFRDANIRNAAIRLINSQLPCRFKGACEEYLVVDSSVSIEVLEGIETRLNMPTSVHQQREHSSRLSLEQVLTNQANDAHALFNLAKLSLSTQDHSSSLELFNRYLELADPIDPEWRWYALFSVARLRDALKDDRQDIVAAYLTAFEDRPSRAEPLYELARYYRESQSYALAHIYSTKAIAVKRPLRDAFDLNLRTYTWHIPAEHALISQQLGHHDQVIEAANAALIHGLNVGPNQRDSLVNSRQKSVEILQRTRATNKINGDTHQAGINRIKLVIPFRNAELYLQDCIRSLESQDYQHFSATFIDDCSTDDSVGLIPSDDSRFTLIKNKERRGALKNRMDFILSCDPNDIIVYLDGDDQLARDDVLSYINQTYVENDCWLTYGQYISQNGKTGQAVPYATFEQLSSVLNTGEMRFPIHPITHRAALFHRIHDFDPDYQCFKNADGEWLFYASDAVLARPLFSMAGIERIHYCNRALYLYTEGHESSVYKSNKKEQIEACRAITLKPRLPIIESL